MRFTGASHALRTRTRRPLLAHPTRRTRAFRASPPRTRGALLLSRYCAARRSGDALYCILGREGSWSRERQPWSNHRLFTHIAHRPLQFPLHLLHARRGRDVACARGHPAHRGDRGSGARCGGHGHPKHPPDGRRAARAPRRGGPRARHRAHARHRERVDDHERRAAAEDGGRPQGGGPVARQHLARHARSGAVQADHASRRAAADARRHRRRARGRVRSREDQRRRRAQPRPGLPRVREAVHRSPAARAVHRVHARGRELGQPRLRLGQGRRRAQRGAVRHHQRARPRRGARRARARRRRPPAGVGAGALLRVPERAGHGGVHLAAVAPFLQRVQPPAPDGRRQAAPVLVLGRRIRPAHRAALGRCASRAFRVRKRARREARRAPRQSRNRTRYEPN